MEKRCSWGGWETEASPAGMGIREIGEHACRGSAQARRPPRKVAAVGKKGAKGTDRTFLAPLASPGTLPPREVADLFARGAAALSWEMRAAAPYS